MTAPSAPFSFRPALEEDVPFLLDLRLTTMSGHQTASGVHLSRSEQLQRLMERFECARIVLLAGEPVGLFKVARDGKEWNLLQIQLIPEKQGCGLGGSIIGQLIAEAAHAGASLHLRVLRTNPARRLYERLGFRVVNESTHAYEMQLDAGGAATTRVRSIEIVTLAPSGLLALLAAPLVEEAVAPVLLFLHGRGEAGSTPNRVPMVCVHQTPPFQAILGKIPGAYVIAPQAPDSPSKDEWNWRDHVAQLVPALEARFPNRRMLACGFSRGGLGVLQLVAARPDAFHAWAAIDPQPPTSAELDAILHSPKIGDGWLRYGKYRARSPAWTSFAEALEKRVPAQNRDTTDLEHIEIALRAFCGDRLASTSKQNLYEFLGLQY
jgi:ribosomal protein S18 acetylase RimI-like enzyme